MVISCARPAELASRRAALSTEVSQSWPLPSSKLDHLKILITGMRVMAMAEQAAGNCYASSVQGHQARKWSDGGVAGARQVHRDPDRSERGSQAVKWGLGSNFRLLI